MSNNLKINQNYRNTTLNIFTPKTTLEHQWAEDVVGGFCDDVIPETGNQPNIIPEQISVDEINHIEVIIIYF